MTLCIVHQPFDLFDTLKVALSSTSRSLRLEERNLKGDLFDTLKVALRNLKGDKLRVPPHPRVLLGMKKRGFGAGRWNGFGGKVREGESCEDAARREMQEEAGITPVGLDKIGVLEFTSLEWPEIIEMHIFRARDFDGEPIETEEMRPAWFEIADIPFREMWPDDIYWFPHFLKGRKFRGSFHFGANDAIIKHTIEIEK